MKGNAANITMKRGLLIALLVISAACCLCMGSYAAWTFTGTFASEPDSSIEATAVFLDENPRRLPPFVTGIEPGRSVEAGGDICARMLPGALLGIGGTLGIIQRNVQIATRVSINGARIPYASLRFLYVSDAVLLPDGSVSAEVAVCFPMDVGAGVHLVEIETSPLAVGVFGVARESFAFAVRAR
jgi:hypothetical protein